MAEHHGSYYIPEPSYWPIVGSIGLMTAFVGAANWLHNHWHGPYMFGIGLFIISIMMIGWFGTVIREGQRGLYDEQVDRSFRWGMIWFIFSEVCFFAVFFGTLFYTRFYSIHVLGDHEYGLSAYLLWPAFKPVWPLLVNPDNSQFVGFNQWFHDHLGALGFEKNGPQTFNYRFVFHRVIGNSFLISPS